MNIPYDPRQKERDKIEDFLALSGPWPTCEVLKTLVLAAEHLLRDHDCDVHGHEEIARAAKVGRERLEALGIKLESKEYIHAKDQG